MAKKREPIRVEAYVTVDGKEVNVDTLSPEQKRKLSTWIKLTVCNELYRGRAVFTAKEEST